MRTACILCFAISVILSGQAWGWGCTGHEVVALIALNHLRPDVKANVEQLLSTQTHDYAGRFCSDLSLDPIAYYATWADDYRGSHPETAPWHFWDIPLSKTTAAANQYCDKGCVVQALNDQLAILRDSSQDQQKRAMALMFVIHFAGDLHQPLHAEDNNDRGGNCVPVNFFGDNTKETNAGTGAYTPNLHGVWDTQLVENVGGISKRNQAGVEAFAQKIDTDKAKTIKKAAAERIDFVAWGNQSHSLARKDPYKKLPTRIAAAKTVAPVTECSDLDTSLNLAKLNESINASYVSAVQNDVELQLAKAAGRLAGILNSVWAQ